MAVDCKYKTFILATKTNTPINLPNSPTFNFSRYIAIKSPVATKAIIDCKAPAKPEATAVPPSADKAEPKPDLKADAKPTSKVEPKPDAQTETKPVTTGKPGAEVSPQLIKKVHKFYEQLGREDVRAVEESEKADRDNRTDKTKTDAKPEDKTKPDEGA